MIKVVQQSDKPGVFDGLFRPGEDRERELEFQAHMTAFLRQEDVLGVAETDEHIRVALAGADQEAFMNKFGEKKVDKANRAWNHVSRLITYPPISSQIWAAGSPGEGWKISKKHYAPQTDAEKSRT